MATPRKVRLGYLGPTIVLVGVALAGGLIWFMQTQRPVAGDVIDTLAIDARRSIVVREEASSDRSFIEFRDGDAMKWRALIPRYAGERGRPAVAWSDKAVTVRVTRNGRAEVFAFSLANAQKLGTYRLAPEKEPIETHAKGPITLTDHVRSYEVVGDGMSWNQLIAVDIVKGGGVWKVDLGPGAVTGGSVEGGQVTIAQGSTRRVFDAASGRETTPAKPVN